MEITPLRTFLALAREGHMTRAAASLHLTQPAVSTQLAHLEEELGQRLFDRTPKGLVLTEAGRTFRAYVEEALARLAEGRSALDRLAGLTQGALAIGGGATATTYLFPPLLGLFHERHPSIRLFVREQGSLSVVEALIRGELDLGVVTLPVPVAEMQAGVGARLEVEPWVEDELRLIVPEGWPLAARRSFTWRDLDGLPMVLFEAGTAVRNLIDRHLADAGIQGAIVMELRSIESIKQMVAFGIGAAFVSRYALGDPEAGLTCEEGPLTRRLALVYRSDRSLSPASQTFLALARERHPPPALTPRRGSPPARPSTGRRSPRS